MSGYQGSGPKPTVTSDSRGAPARLGRYELIGHLATGGMAEIHLARLAGEGGFEKIVVVKRLLPELVASPAYVAMFLDEGKLVARLDHPNICEVHELGREGAEYYLAMPYLDGVAVHELIARPRDHDRIGQLRVAAGVIVQACAGLHHAHELRDADGAPAGLVHRDVSPSNLFVTSAGVVKVLDFGVAKVRGAAETEVGTIKGKQQYMAPEQLLGEPLDRRCDVFALGIVLFELATHQRLFKRASDYLTARAVLEEPVPRADAIDPAVPAALADVIAKALARAPAERYATAAALGAAVEHAMAAHGGIAGPSAIAAAIASSDELSQMRTRQARVLGEAQSKARAPSATQLDAAPTRPLRGAAPTDPPTLRTPARRRRAPLALAALLGAGAIAVVVLAISNAGDPERGAAGAPVRDDGARRDFGAPASDDRGRGAAGSTDVAPIAGEGRRGSAGSAQLTSTAADGAGAAQLASPVGDRAPGFEVNIGVAGATDDGSPGGQGARGTPVPASGAARLTDRASASRAGSAEGGAKHRGDGAAGSELRAGTDEARRTSPATDERRGARDTAERPRRDGHPPEGARAPMRGLFSIDSTPYATIYVDGTSLGVTPIVKRALPAGKHRLRAVLANGRSKELTIDVPANRLAKPVQLTW